MKDLYSAQNYQKFLQKQKKEEKKNEVDIEIEQKAKEIEQQNYQMAKAARIKLEQGYSTQKKTTKELLSQGEKLEKASADAEEIDENIQEGKYLAKKIEEEGKLFNFKVPFLGTIKNAFTSEKKKTKEKQQKVKNLPPKEITSINSLNIPKKNLLPGQEKTDEELAKIYLTLKNVNQGAKFQHEEIERQQKNIKNISDRSKKSKDNMEEVEEKLKNL
ncbi:hypothetical protein M153_16500013927 [Pseudoloma neurophilia]|uniref:Uncharacterized protein n=1 Tax=Pseudoloma neurophilia TaxID=146866 RepID=A0A0R0M6X8_9MICR|nr:hypothetical protein M153_16500013927 [Pseudoloma neurophilia]